MSQNDLVIIFDEGVYGVVLNYGAHASYVKYCLGGIEHRVYVENDDFRLVEDD